MQLINEPTRITQTTRTILDLAFVSKPEMVTASGVHHLGLSDHSLIYVVRKCKKIKSPPKITKSRSYKNFTDTNFTNSHTVTGKPGWVLIYFLIIAL